MTEGNSLSDVEAAYLAGLIDGEGNLSIQLINHKNRPNGKGFILRLQIMNTNKDVLLWAKQKIGAGTFYRYPTLQKPYHRRLYSLAIYGRTLRWLVPRLLPYSIIKKKELEIMLKAFDLIHVGGQRKRQRFEEMMQLSQQMKVFHRAIKPESCEVTVT